MNLIRCTAIAVVVFALNSISDCRGEDAVKALDEICPATFRAMQLGDVMDVLADTHNVRIRFAEGIDTKSMITYSGVGKTLRVVLTDILVPLKLNFTAEGETITIAPQKKK